MMMRKSGALSVFAACILSTASFPLLAADAAACHGPDGNTPVAPDFPRLGGQYYDYLVKALEGYKSGARKNPVMNPLAANLTQRDIEDLAAFYSGQRGLVTKY